MLDFRTVGKLENGSWVVEIFDEPFKTKEGRIVTGKQIGRAHV